MTCIVGLMHDGIVYMGADSMASNGYTRAIRKDKKVFKLKSTKGALAGFTTSFRMGQLLMYADNLIDDTVFVDHEYLVTHFIPSIQKLFEEGGFSKNTSGELSAGDFLLAYNNKLYTIFSDYQVAEDIENYASCGSGEPFALGSLYSTEGSVLSPEERIHKALQAASAHCPTVSAPYYIMNTKNNEVKEYNY